MKVNGNYPMYRLAIRLTIPVLVLLLYAPFISNNGMYVLCLEGNGQITVEKKHYNGTNPFLDDSKQASRSPLPYNNKCNNTNHVNIAEISSANDTCSNINFDSPQFLQDVIQPPTEYIFNKHIAFTSFHNHPSTANQRIKAIRSTVLLI